MLRRKSIRPLRMFLCRVFSPQWVPNPRFIDLEWYKNIFGNNNTNYIKAMCQADNVPNLYSKNCNFLLSLHLEVYCFLLLLFINLRKWDSLHLQWQIYFYKNQRILWDCVDFQVRQIGLLKYFGNTSLYIKARVPH